MNIKLQKPPFSENTDMHAVHIKRKKKKLPVQLKIRTFNKLAMKRSVLMCLHQKVLFPLHWCW